MVTTRAYTSPYHEAYDLKSASQIGAAQSCRLFVIIPGSSLIPIDFDGLRILDYTAAQGLGASLAMIEVPPGGRHPEAWSKRSDKYYLVIRGEIRFALDRRSASLAVGDFCFVKQGQRFSYSNEGVESAALVLFHCPSFDIDAEVFVENA
jgi:mannose-6-phosphate isomerase-like protein (cupin superfamily)